MKKRLLAILLSFTLAIPMNSLTALASEVSTQETKEEVTEEQEKVDEEDSTEEDSSQGQEAQEADDSTTEEEEQKVSTQSENVASGTCGDDLTWALDDEGTLTISGTGEMTNYGARKDPWYSYRSDITNVVLPVALTSIGECAFWGCSRLTSIDLPDSVTSIGLGAFIGCGLTSIDLPDGVTSIEESTFGECSGLTSIDLPDSLTSIGDEAFYKCSSLTSIELPDGITSIEERTFYKCSNLTSIELSDGLTSIGECAFAGCSSLTSIDLSDGLASIGEGAFDGCSSLTSIELPESLTSIGEYAFEDCSSLTSIELPDGITSIEYCTFDNCSSLTSIEIPANVTSIESGVFYNCSSLTSIKVDSENSVYDSRNDCNAIIETDTNQLIFGCKSTKIPDSVTSIGSSAFEGCNSLTSIDIPNSITSIGSYAFYNCSSLTSIDLPDGITSIADSTFYNCSSLTSIRIPDSVTSIGYHVFEGCSSLTSIKIPDSVTSIEHRSFVDGKASGTCGSGLTWTLDLNDEGTLTISGTGEIRDYHGEYYDPSDYAPWYSIRFYIKNVVLSDGITSIGKIAFEDCSRLTSLEIPDSVTSIRITAFSGCSSLTSIKIDSENSVYDSRNDCNAIIETDINQLIFGCKSTKIPNSVTSIGNDAFYDCSSLTSIDIPNSVTSIGAGAFRNCSSLKSITIPSGVTEIDEYAFSDELEKIVILNKDCDISDDSEAIPTSAIIYGYADSTAENYAQKYDMTFVEIDESDHIWSDWKDVSITSGDGTVSKRVCVICGAVELQDAVLRTAVKKSYQLDFTNILYGTLSYSSANKKIATVSSTGLVKGVKVGTTTITVKSSGDETHAANEVTITVTVPTSITKADLTKTSYTYNGEEQMPGIKKVNGSTKLVDGTDYEVEWPETSVKPGTYSVKITGIGKYIGTITKTYKINKANQTVSLSIPTVYVNSTSQISVDAKTSTYTYSSSSKKYATVDENGVITGVKAGTTYITVTAAADDCYNKASKKVKVKVLKKTQKFEPIIDIEPTDEGKLTLAVGSTANITAEGVGKITYSSSNKKYATVSSSGVVTAKKAGSVKITVKAAGDNEYNAATKKFTITVTK